jgi:hypothetical protein
MRKPELVRALLFTAAGACLFPDAVQAQSTVLPIPRIERHELRLLAVAPDVVSGPRSSWAELAAAPEGELDDPTDFGLQGRMRLLDESPYSDAAGRIATQRAGWQALLGRRLEGGGLFALGLDTEASFYDFSGPGAAGVGDPFNDVYESRLRSTLYTPLDRELSVFTGLELAYGGESEADLASGLTAGAAVGASYRASENLEVSLGVAAASRLEDDAYALPFIGVDWQLTGSTRLVAEGPEVRLEQRFTAGLDGYLLADYDLRQFRLDEDGPLDGGAFRDEQIDLGAGLNWTPIDGVRIGVEGGLTVWRELTTLSADGADLGVTEVDPAPFVGFTLTASF